MAEPCEKLYLEDAANASDVGGLVKSDASSVEDYDGQPSAQGRDIASESDPAREQECGPMHLKGPVVTSGQAGRDTSYRERLGCLQRALDAIAPMQDTSIKILLQMAIHTEHRAAIGRLRTDPAVASLPIAMRDGDTKRVEIECRGVTKRLKEDHDTNEAQKPTTDSNFQLTRALEEVRTTRSMDECAAALKFSRPKCSEKDAPAVAE